MSETNRPLVVVAIGGNATYPPDIKGTAEEQFAIIERSCRHLVDMVEAGWRLVITHGNGPVVGNILFRMARTAAELQPMPMDVCVSHSQGGIGYMIQQSLVNALKLRGHGFPVASVVTQVEVDPADPAFGRPTKPVGKYFARGEAERIARETGWTFAEDGAKGWRRVVASPEPRRIVELDVVRRMVEEHVIPIACGGGGIPVVRRKDGGWTGVPAVIDKDMTSALLAGRLGADALLILTGVEKVALDFAKPSQRDLDVMTAAEARRYLADGQFPEGNMGPKVRAALRYLDEDGKTAVITSLEHGRDALDGKAGTRVLS